MNLSPTDVIISLLRSKASCGMRFTEEEAAYDLAYLCGGMTQRERAKRWRWNQSRVCRLSRIVAMAAHHILSENALQDALLNQIESNHCEIEPETKVLNQNESKAPIKEKEKEQKEKVAQKEKKEREKEHHPPKEKPPKGVKKKNPPSSETTPQGEVRRFRKPAFSEALAYFRQYVSEKHISIDPESEAEAWWDHKQSNGWKVGKTPMKDWRATIRTWCRTDFRSYQKPASNHKPNGHESTRTYDGTNDPELAHLYRVDAIS